MAKSDRVDLTWPDDSGRAWRIVESVKVSYPFEQEIIINGKKVIERSRTEFMVAHARPATNEEIERWRKQP